MRSETFAIKNYIHKHVSMTNRKNVLAYCLQAFEMSSSYLNTIASHVKSTNVHPILILRFQCAHCTKSWL